MESLGLFSVVTCILALALPASFALKAQGLPAQEGVNPDALIIQDFENRVSEYAKLHKAIEAKLPSLKPTDVSKEIADHQHELARRIIEERKAAKQGDIFTARIISEFRRLIAIVMRGQNGINIRTSLAHAEPVPIEVGINTTYPVNLPLQSTPPTLLLNLPKLPSEIDYRIVGKALFLRDVPANLIIDFMPDAIP
jgi:hypothetical protein